jgi:SprT-like family
VKKYSPMLTKIYELYNTAYFNGRLPKIRVYFGTLPRKTYGHTCFDFDTRRATFITINQRIKTLDWQCTACFTLLHEMCHVSIGLMGKTQKENHGEEFQKEKHRVIALGAVDDLL